MSRYIKIYVFFVFSFICGSMYAQDNSQTCDITFFVASDLHFDVPPETDQYYHIVGMNSLSTKFNWPEKINDTLTGFMSAGEKINEPLGIILTGDITDRAEPEALKLLKQRYEKGEGKKQIHFPVYLGLGNHDLDPQHVGENNTAYANQMLAYVKERHYGDNAPVPVKNFDEKSRAYSWDWQGVHFIMAHTFPGETKYGLSNNLEWIKNDLKKNAPGGKPVIIFQHYGFDQFSFDWWSKEQRENFRKVIDGYNIIGIFAGHNHFAEIIDWDGIPVFQINNAWKDDDSEGSFAACRITGNQFELVTCRVLDGEGTIKLSAPFYSKNISNKSGK